MARETGLRREVGRLSADYRGIMVLWEKLSKWLVRRQPLAFVSRFESFRRHQRSPPSASWRTMRSTRVSG